MRLLTKILLVPLLIFAATFAAAQTSNTPFQHVIIVVQENRTPDNLFGSDLLNNPRRLPNAHLASSGKCESSCGCANDTQPLQALNIDTCADPDHGHNQQPTDDAWTVTYDSGSMDGTCKVYMTVTSCTGQYPRPSCYNSANHEGVCPYTYVQNVPGFCPTCEYGVVEPYFQIATNYGFANWMFQTN